MVFHGSLRGGQTTGEIKQHYPANSLNNVFLAHSLKTKQDYPKLVDFDVGRPKVATWSAFFHQKRSAFENGTPLDSFTFLGWCLAKGGRMKQYPTKIQNMLEFDVLLSTQERP